MNTVPADTPETIPVVLPTVARAELELLQEPPPVVDARVVLLPIHVSAVPVIDEGTGFTVMSRVL